MVIEPLVFCIVHTKTSYIYRLGIGIEDFPIIVGIINERTIKKNKNIIMSLNFVKNDLRNKKLCKFAACISKI